MLVIYNGMIIVSDGVKEPKTGYIVTQGTEIIEVGWGETPDNILNNAKHKLDAKGGYVLPGIINHHVHCCVMGPALPVGLQTLPEEEIIDNLNKHMMQGTTTVLNVDGFVNWEEVEYTNKKHPINIKTTTSHTPMNIKAEKLVPGSNFKPEYEQITVEDMLENGAVAIGEIGGGHTLGGANQEYRYMPMSIEEATGKRIDQREARELKDSVLGRYIDPSMYNQEEVLRVLQKISLDLTPEQAREIVSKSVMPTFEVALKGIDEACDLARKMRVPVIVHNSAPSMPKIAEVAPLTEHFLIAAHSNHPTFEAKEAVEHSMYLRRCGAIFERASSFNNKNGRSCES